MKGVARTVVDEWVDVGLDLGLDSDGFNMKSLTFFLSVYNISNTALAVLNSSMFYKENCS